MSRENKKYYYYAEITIEAVSPLVLASGKTGNFFDVELVRDANGLPAIPGTTIAGILRHAVHEKMGKETEYEIFGFQSENEGCSSSLEVSWAYVHDSKNCIHKSFYPRSKIEVDAILSHLYINDNPDFKRDHVSLSDKGVVAGTGKFDRYFVPTGSRFTFSIGLWSEKAQDDNWTKILNILFSSSFRIGAAGRAGYGKIKVVDINMPSNDCFDISKVEDINTFKKCTRKFDFTKGIEDDTEKIEITLLFPLGFRVGGGSKSFLNSNHTADMLPYSERIIKWDGNNGAFERNPRITIPGSAIKGALRHRTAYHLARITKKWNRDEEDDGLSELFGSAANKNNLESIGLAGKVWFTDLYLEDSKTYELSRNSIDQFTGGTLDGALFQEENVSSNQSFKACIYLDKKSNKDSKEYRAFEWALEDLLAGRLAIGGGSGHGLGFNYIEGEN